MTDDEQTGLSRRIWQQTWPMTLGVLSLLGFNLVDGDVEVEVSDPNAVVAPGIGSHLGQIHREGFPLEHGFGEVQAGLVDCGLNAAIHLIRSVCLGQGEKERESKHCAILARCALLS